MQEITVWFDLIYFVKQPYVTDSDVPLVQNKILGRNSQNFLGKIRKIFVIFRCI